MNTRRLLPASVGAVLLVGVTWWSGRLGPQPAAAPLLPPRAAPPSGGAAPPLEEHVPALAGDRTESSGDTDPVTRSTAGMLALMRRAEGLSADDPDQFQTLAALTNEFDNGLAPATAALLVRHMPSGFLATAWGDMALRRWAGADRPSAAAWMAANPDPSPIAAAALAHGWFAQDPEGALAYLADLPAGPWKTNMANSVAEDALVAREPEAAARCLAVSPADNPRLGELREWIALHWGARSHAEASAWADRAGDPATRERLLAAVSVGHANVDPLAAAESLLARVGSPDLARPALASIVRIWTNTDPAAAADWVSAFPPGPEQQTSIEQLLAVWAPANPAAARAWQNALSDLATRDFAAGVLERMSAESQTP